MSYCPYPTGYLEVYRTFLQAIDTALKKVRGLKEDISVMFFSVDENSKKIFAMCAMSPVSSLFTFILLTC
jgi:hypothetical protein